MKQNGLRSLSKHLRVIVRTPVLFSPNCCIHSTSAGQVRRPLQGPPRAGGEEVPRGLERPRHAPRAARAPGPAPGPSDAVLATLANFAKFCKFLAGSFSAVSRPIFASKYHGERLR